MVVIVYFVYTLSDIVINKLLLLFFFFKFNYVVVFPAIQLDLNLVILLYYCFFWYIHMICKTQVCYK